MGGEVISINLAAREADQFNAEVCEWQGSSIIFWEIGKPFYSPV
jgi:hypothetical protein